MSRWSALLATVGLAAGVGCYARPLEPINDKRDAATPTDAGMPTEDGVSADAATPTDPGTPDLVPSLRVLDGPNARLIVGSNAGAVTGSPEGLIHVFEEDPETLVEAAAVVGMPVCSVEFNRLVISTPAPEELTISAARAVCDQDDRDLADMLGRLSSLKTASTVVVIAANTAITVHSTNNGINFFYDDDIVRLLRAARRLYVPACLILPDVLSVPMAPTGMTPGVSIEDALARCGRQ